MPKVGGKPGPPQRYRTRLPPIPPVYLCVRRCPDSRVRLTLVVLALAFYLAPRHLFHRCEHAHGPAIGTGTEAVLAEVCAVCDIALPGTDAVPCPLITEPTLAGSFLFSPFTPRTAAGIEVCTQVRGPPGMMLV